MNSLLDRIPGRALALVVAVLLAAIAVVSINNWVNAERNKQAEELQLVRAYRITNDLPAGTEAAVILEEGLYTEIIAPRDSLPLGFITDITGIEGFLGIDVRAGSVFYDRLFVAQAPSTAAFEIPPGQVAVSVDVDVTAGVANFIDPGDRISILVNVGGARADAEEAGAAGQDAATRFLLQNVEVLAIGRRITNGVPDDVGAPRTDVVLRDDNSLTLTLALDAADAERIVFATSTGELYIVLLPPDVVGDFAPATTPGRNADNLFDR